MFCFKYLRILYNFININVVVNYSWQSCIICDTCQAFNYCPYNFTYTSQFCHDYHTYIIWYSTFFEIIYLIIYREFSMSQNLIEIWVMYIICTRVHKTDECINMILKSFVTSSGHIVYPLNAYIIFCIRTYNIYNNM